MTALKWIYKKVRRRIITKKKHKRNGTTAAQKDLVSGSYFLNNTLKPETKSSSLPGRN